MNSKHILLGLLMVAVFAVGIAVGRFGLPSNNVIQSNQPSPMNSAGNATATGTTTRISEGTVDSIVSAMTEDQKAALGALGIDVNRITPEMVLCAEASLGAARVEEIKNGASLSFTEKLSLVSCYK